MDLGCGLGQDLRALVRDGAPADNLVGLDLMHEYIDLGYELFQDRGKLSSTFIVQDFFEDTPEIDNLARKAKIMNSGYFMHLWTWGTQLNVAKRMMQLVASERGAIFSGSTLGDGQQEPGTLCPLASVRCFCTIRKHSLSFGNRPEQRPRLSGSFKLSSRMMNIARTLIQRDVG